EAMLEALAEHVTRLESIAEEERLAIERLDAEKLLDLATSRETIREAMQAEELRGHQLLRRAGLPDDAPLASLLAHLPADTAARLSARKDALRLRLQRLETLHVENHLRLRATFDITTALLRHLGVDQVRQTYGPGIAR
ncbi:MAG: flagellar export chaperone FlgN, partial [Mariprofundaceae bacterium]